MLKSSTGYERSVQTVTWAICGRFETLVTVHNVSSSATLVRLTSKYGSSSVAAGATLMSQLSSLFVVAGEPVRKVASALTPPANAEPDTAMMAIRAQTKVFLISISYTQM